MSRSFVFQAALSAALLMACAPLFAFEPSADRVRAPAQEPGNDSPWVYLGPQRAQVERLAISSLDPDRMLVVLGEQFDTPIAAPIFQSDEAGREWRRGPLLTGLVYDLALDDSDRALAADRNGLSVRDVGQTRWDLWTHPELEFAVSPRRVAPAPGEASPVWVTGHHDWVHRVYRLSHDLESWADVTPLDMPEWAEAAEIAVSATQPGRVAVVAVQNPQGVARVFITHDNGVNWSASVLPGMTARLSTLRWVGDRLFVGGMPSSDWRSRLWASSDFGDSWEVLLVSATSHQSVMDVAGNRMAPAHLWAGTAEGLYTTIDAGVTWAGPAPGNEAPITRLEFEPQRNELWAGRRDSGTWVSSDGGDSWQARNHRLGAQPVSSLSANPLQAGEMAAAIQSPVFSTGQVATSMEGGLAWSQNTAPPSATVGAVRFGPSGDLYATLSGFNAYTLMRRGPGNEWRHVGFDWADDESSYPELFNFGASEDTLVMSVRFYNFDTGARGYRVWRSGDEGQTWQAVLESAQYNTYTGIERTQGPDGPRLFVFEQSYDSQSPSRLWGSSDEGQTWSDVTSGLPPGYIGQFCTGTDGQMLMHLMDSATYTPRMYRSNDGGANWVQTGWSPVDFVDGAPLTTMHCPGDARQVFLGGHSGWLWMSEDGGETFEGATTGTVGGTTALRSIVLTDSGLYVGHNDGVWVNPDITLPPTSPSGLTFERTQARMRYRVTLQWHGGDARVDIRHNGTVMATVPNTGHWSDGVLANRQAPTWQVCNAGTAECSDVVAGN